MFPSEAHRWFEEFLNDRKAEREREAARELEQARNEGAKSIYFIDGYVKVTVGRFKDHRITHQTARAN